MSDEYITTNELVDMLVESGYRVIEDTDPYDGYINILDGTVSIGSARTDQMYSFKINAALKDDFRKRLFTILCDYAATPLDYRIEKSYTLRISETNLYLTDINKHEIKVVTNDNLARLYGKNEVIRAKELASRHSVVLKEEEVDATN